MADDPGRTVDDRVKDLELLESGNFADVEIICGDRTWKCHRAILVPRSIWFEKALAGLFEEASNRRVNLDEENPFCVGLALEYIYGRGLDVEASIPLEHCMEHCIALWHIADFLLLHPLKDLLEDAVHEYCDIRMKTLCTIGRKLKWCDQNDRSKLSPWALDFVLGIQEAYKWEARYLKEVLMEFMWAGKWWTLGPRVVPALLNQLKNTPDFMNDLLGQFAARPWITNAVWAPCYFAGSLSNRNNTCLLCHKDLILGRKDEPGVAGQIRNPFVQDSANRDPIGWCKDCGNLGKIPWRK